MIIDFIFFDKILKPLDTFLGLSKLSITSYLFIVFLTVFFLSLILLKQKPNTKTFGGSSKKSPVKTNIVLALAVLLVLVGIISSVGKYHYTLLYIFGLFSLIISLYLSIINKANTRLLIISIIVLVYAMGSRHLVVGIEEHETTSDMINIYLNGHFKWSIHGSHYDLAPLDAIAKVILSYIQGLNIYSDVTASVLYTSYGLFAILMTYSFLKRIGIKPHIAVPVIALASLSYPYSPILNLSIPPPPMSQIFSVATLVLALLNIYKRSIDLGFYPISVLFIISSVLIHPISLGLIMFLMVLSLTPIALRNRLGFKAARVFMPLLVIAITVYFAKIFYTSFATGFVNYMETIVNYISAAFGRVSFSETLTTRNLGYSFLPRISISAFAVLPAVIGAYTISLLYHIIRGKRISFEDYIYLTTVFLYATYTIASLLIGIGGVSQSRVIFNGVQQFMELATILHLALRVSRSTIDFRAIGLLLLIPVITTLLTPNAFPLNYTIPMSKPATYSDHLITYTFFKLLDKSIFIKAYQSYGNEISITAIQDKGSVYYGLAATQAVTYYFIAPRLIDAKSYWDPKVMSAWRVTIWQLRGAYDYTGFRVMDAWIYNFQLKIRSG